MNYVKIKNLRASPVQTKSSSVVLLSASAMKNSPCIPCSFELRSESEHVEVYKLLSGTFKPSQFSSSIIGHLSCLSCLVHTQPKFRKCYTFWQ